MKFNKRCPKLILLIVTFMFVFSLFLSNEASGLTVDNNSDKASYVKAAQTCITVSKSYQQGVDNCTKAISLDSSYSLAYVVRAQAYLSLQQYGKSTSDCEKAISLKPSFGEGIWNPYYIEGSDYMLLGNFEKAVGFFNQSIKIDSKFSLAYSNNGYCLWRLKNYDQALINLNKAILLDSCFAVAYNNRGLVFLNTEKFDKALSDFNKAISLDSQYIVGYYNRGITYYYMKKYDEAIGDFEKTITLNSGYGEAYYMEGITYYTQKSYMDVIDPCTKYINMVTDNINKAKGYVLRGLSYESLGKNDLALSDYNQGLVLDQANKVAQDAIKRLSTTPLPAPSPTINTVGNTISNSFNGSFATIQGDWIYFKNVNDDSKLYKIKTDNTGLTKICDDRVSCVNVVGDWVYYINNNDNGKIYKIKLDGTSKTKVYIYPVSNFIVTADSIYLIDYNSNSKLYKIDTNGKNRKLIVNLPVYGVCIYKNSIYYTFIPSYNGEYYRLNRINIDGSGDKPVFSSEIKIDKFIGIDNDEIYYLSPSITLLKRSLYSDEDTQILSSGQSDNANISAGWLYYESGSDGYSGCTFKIKPDLTNNTRIYPLQTRDGYSGDISCGVYNIVGNWIYFSNGQKCKLDGSELSAY